MLLENKRILEAIKTLKGAWNFNHDLVIKLNDNLDEVIVELKPCSTDKFIVTFSDYRNGLNVELSKELNDGDRCQEDRALTSLGIAKEITEENSKNYYLEREYKIKDKRIICIVTIKLGNFLTYFKQKDERPTYKFEYEVDNQVWLAQEILRGFDEELLQCLILK